MMAPQRSPAHRQLDVFVGTWRARGDSFGSPEQNAGNPRASAMSWTSEETRLVHLFPRPAEDELHVAVMRPRIERPGLELRPIVVSPVRGVAELDEKRRIIGALAAATILGAVPSAAFAIAAITHANRGSAFVSSQSSRDVLDDHPHNG